MNDLDDLDVGLPVEIVHAGCGLILLRTSRVEVSILALLVQDANQDEMEESEELAHDVVEVEGGALLNFRRVNLLLQLNHLVDL